MMFIRYSLIVFACLGLSSCKNSSQSNWHVLNEKDFSYVNTGEDTWAWEDDVLHNRRKREVNRPTGSQPTVMYFLFVRR